MLQINIPKIERWDEKKEEFIYTEEQTLFLEHSLSSISKWESKWCKPFLSKEQKTHEEIIDYIKCMSLEQITDENVYDYISDDNIKKIEKYINAPMTATTFSEEPGAKPSRQILTNELIYYSMIANNIPFECQEWHLNRLMTLIRVCEIKNRPPKKRSKREIMSRNDALNAARRLKLNSKG